MTAPATARPDRIVVVDDDARIRDLLRRYLTQEGFDVLLAEDGKALNRLLTRENIDMIVLDLMLPGEDGLSICRRLRAANDTTPIIMGHSFGGAFTQMLLDAGFGAAGVSLDGAAVKGIKALPFSEIKATFPVLKNPLNHDKAVPITEKEFHYAFTNNLTDEESKAVYDRYSVPVSGRILFQGGFANFTPNAATTYNFANDDRAPLLFVAGGNDHILPPAVQHENYKKNTKHSEAITAYKLFDGRSHYTCGEPGWEAVADFALDWALSPVAGELS